MLPPIFVYKNEVICERVEQKIANSYSTLLAFVRTAHLVSTEFIFSSSVFAFLRGFRNNIIRHMYGIHTRMREVDSNRNRFLCAIHRL